MLLYLQLYSAAGEHKSHYGRQSWSSGPWLQAAHLDKLLQLQWVQPCVKLTTTVQMVCIRIHPVDAGATPCH